MGRGEGFKSCLIFQEEKTLSLIIYQTRYLYRRKSLNQNKQVLAKSTEVKVEGKRNITVSVYAGFAVIFFYKYCNELY